MKSSEFYSHRIGPSFSLTYIKVGDLNVKEGQTYKGKLRQRVS